MKHYDSIENIKYDKTLLGCDIYAFNKLDGQNFCVKYNPKKKEFADFGSRKRNVDETDEQFGDCVKFFKKNVADNLLKIIEENSKKKMYFNGAEEVTFYFEWWGEHSFAGFHQEEDKDNMHLSIIDVNIKKKGYIEPKTFIDIFVNDDRIETPELVYYGKLNNEFIKSINMNDWTKEGCQYPMVKEGVVCRNVSLLKGQRMPKVKIKTDWWINKLHENFTEDKWKELE